MYNKIKLITNLLNETVRVKTRPIPSLIIIIRQVKIATHTNK